MKKFGCMGRAALLLALVGVLCFALSGCAALAGPTDGPSTPAWVSIIDRFMNVQKTADGQVTKGPAPDPTGGSIPVVSGILGLIGVAWYTIRKLSTSVPADTHDQAVAGLSNSTPAEPGGK